MDEVSHALPSPNPFDQAEASSVDTLISFERENPIDGGMIQVEGYCRCFSLDEVRIATNNFDEALVLGLGGFGKTYTGLIHDGPTAIVVAIKRLNAESNQGAEEFWTEVKLLSKFHHTNLVSFIGYCYENQEMILVYEYVAHGTLSSHLYKSSGEESGKSISHLKWSQRLNICLGAARGLDYLHTSTKQFIIHRDVKSLNILLDENWVAKVSDFGISISSTSETTTHVSTKVKGTRGYLDPDYFYTNRITRKSDVYAFGVVLLEVFCGRPPLDDRLEEEQISLILWAQTHIQNAKLDRIIDPSLKGEITPQSLKYFAKLANSCLRTKPKERPTMSEVVKVLQNALALHERKVRSRGVITKVFRGLKLVAGDVSHWWGERWNGSRDGSFREPLFDNFTQSEYTCFSLADIHAATNNFDEGLLIDGDSFARLYKGCNLGGTLVVAIKRYETKLMKELNFTKLFSAEIQVQSLTRHPNIVPLIGFCKEEHEFILVYDCMVNGTLNSNLHGQLHNPLLWKKRLQICIDIAQGLKYLQTNVELHFVYRNIKPSNIFLDDKCVAKVAAFEFSVPIPSTITIEAFQTDVCCRIGYADPEYFLYGKVTKKSVVYTFGVMLLEILCAKKTYAHLPNADEDSLLPWFKGCIKRGTIDEVIDPYLVGKIAPKCLMYFVNIALSCVVNEGSQRPYIDDVLGSLQSSMQLQEAWENSIDEYGTADIPNSYNDVVFVDSEFTIDGQSFLISDLV